MISLQPGPTLRPRRQTIERVRVTFEHGDYLVAEQCPTTGLVDALTRSRGRIRMIRVRFDEQCDFFATSVSVDEIVDLIGMLTQPVEPGVQP